MPLNFEIQAAGPVSSAFVERGIVTFEAAASFVQLLPYRRNRDKDDLLSLFKDGCGTCSTKHALLKQLAVELGIEGLQLVLGLFKMNGRNTPEVASTLGRHGLAYIPEAHCYLKYEGQRLDFTKPNSSPADFVNDLLVEIELLPNQINGFKIDFHKKYLSEWLLENTELDLTLEALWAIREQCIMDLANAN